MLLPPHTRRGVSLVELLVCVAIIAILMGLTIPAVAIVRNASNKTQSQNNLRQIALASNNYATTAGNFPPFLGWGTKNGVGAEGATVGSYFFHILPQMGEGLIVDKCFSPYFDLQSNVFPNTTAGKALAQSQGYRQYLKNGRTWVAADGVTRPWAAGVGAFRTYNYVKGDLISPAPVVSSYLARGDTTITYGASGNGGWCSYALNGCMDKAIYDSFRDGQSNTIMLAEWGSDDWWAHTVEGVDDTSPGRPDYWLYYYDTGYESSFPSWTVTGADKLSPNYWDTETGTWVRDPGVQSTPPFTSFYKDGSICVAMIDGSVRVISSAVSYESWNAAVSPSSGDLVGVDFGN